VGGGGSGWGGCRAGGADRGWGEERRNLELGLPEGVNEAMGEATLDGVG